MPIAVCFRAVSLFRSPLMVPSVPRILNPNEDERTHHTVQRYRNNLSMTIRGLLIAYGGMYFLHYTPCIESKNIMLREFLAADEGRGTVPCPKGLPASGQYVHQDLHTLFLPQS